MISRLHVLFSRSWYRGRLQSTAIAEHSKGDSYTIDAALRDHFAPVLRAHGFKGSGRHFRRVSAGVFQAVNIQGSMGGGMFAVNLGIHPLGLPVFLDETLDVKKARELECEFRRRLSKDGADQWWSYFDTRASVIEAAQEAADVFERHGMPLFHRQADHDGPLFTLTPEQYEFEGARPLSGFANSGPRMALALARIRKQQGKLTEARHFALIGLTPDSAGWLGHTLLRELADDTESYRRAGSEGITTKLVAEPSIAMSAMGRMRPVR